MALINQNSIIGITSITSPSASNVLTVHTNDTTERLRVSTSGLSFSGTNASLDTSGNISAVDGTFTGNVSIGGTLTYEDVTNIDSVGIITAQSDISIADKIIHTGDTNTAIRFPAVDTITAETAGSERLRITSGGNIGIGTDNPSDELSVVSSLTTDSVLRLQGGNSAGKGSGIRLMKGASAVGYIGPESWLFGSANTSDTLVISQNAQANLSITSAGKAGIGLTNPQTELHVKGLDGYAELRLEGISTGAGTIEFYNQTTKVADIYADNTNNIVFRNTTERLRINSSGQVSLGNNPTVASDAALHIELDGAREYLRLNADAGNNNAYLEIQADDNRRKAVIFKSGGTRRGVIGVGDSDESSATSLFLSASANIAGNNPHMVITSDGNVSINRANPNSWPKLTIRESGSTISSGNAINGSTMKGIHLSNSNNDDTSIGIWSTNGDAHWSGISFQRQNSSSTWGTDIRFYTHENATADLTYTRERMRIHPDGAVTKPHNPSANWSIQIPNTANHVRTFTEKRDAAGNLSGENAGNGSSHGSVGRFTAPVAGTYLFTIRGTSTTSTSSNNELLSVYGSWSSSNVMQPNAEVIDTRSAVIGNDGFGMAFTLYMNVNDYWALDWYRPNTGYTNNPAVWDISVVLLG